MKDNYVANQRQEKSESTEHRIQDLLEREQDRGSVAKRLGQLEEQVKNR